jgi:hypothetical protein
VFFLSRKHRVWQRNLSAIEKCCAHFRQACISSGVVLFFTHCMLTSKRLTFCSSLQTLRSQHNRTRLLMTCITSVTCLKGTRQVCKKKAPKLDTQSLPRRVRCRGLARVGNFQA